MRKTSILALMVLGITLVLLSKLVYGQVNLDFRINVEDKIFYPNETIPINVTVVNRDLSFSAKDVTLLLKIADREYKYDLGEVKAGDSFFEKITLPQFPPGTHTIEGILNYTGMFDEVFTIKTYGSFEVRFPEIERFPRNINVVGFDLPEKLIAGKTYHVKVQIKNSGEIDGNLIVEIASLNESVSEQTTLKAGETKTIDLNVTFYNAGISLIEARIYAIVDNIKYLLDYSGKKSFVQEENLAKLSFDRLEFIDEADNQINQNDEAKIKIYLKNTGEYAASNLKAILKSSFSQIEVTKKDAETSLITPEESAGLEFALKTNEAEVKEYILDLEISYLDSSWHDKTISVPISINSGGDLCKSDKDCGDTEQCSSESKCEAVPCACGSVKNHKCIKYECCFDSECEEDLICNQEKHKCEVPLTFQRDLIILTLGGKLDKTQEYYNIINKYRDTIQSEGLSSFYVELDSPKLKKFFNIELTDSSDWKEVRDIIHKIIDKTKAEYLLILGGVDVIPQPPANTEAEIPTIPVSDDRYADIDYDTLPDIATGRIPTVAGDKSTEIIVKTLKAAIKMRKKPAFFRVILADICIFPPDCSGLYDVNYVSNILFNKNCLETDNCYPAPPYCTGFRCSKKDEFFTALLNNDIIYLDAHGSPWSFAASTNDGWYSILDSSDLYKKQFINNPIFSTAACHSGTIDCEEYGCINKKGSVYSFLANGASAYMGSTRYGFSYTSKMIGDFYDELKKGDSIGKALLDIKRAKLKWWVVSDWMKAIIYELQLYGDPTLKIKLE